LREQAQLMLEPSHELTAGFDINQRTLDFSLNSRNLRCTQFDPNCSFNDAPLVQSSQSLQQDQQDAYLNDRWRFAPQWTLTSGLRLTRDDYLKTSALQPRLGLEWAWSAQTTFTAGAGRHSESPSLEQTVPTLGNPALLQLQSNQVAVGIAQKLDAGWSWRAEAYKKRFTGLVLSDPLLNYRNGGSGTAHGVELLVKKDATKKLSGFLSLTLAQARRRNDGSGQTFSFDYDEPVILTTAVQYKLSERWQFGAKWSYHSGAPFTPIVGAASYLDGAPKPIYGDINSQRVPAYHRLDLRADWRISDRFTGYAEIVNAYARKNVAGYTYSANYSSRQPVYQLPFMPSVGVQYTF
jgi:outer membrane receptor protein involved in Fe transport